MRIVLPRLHWLVRRAVGRITGIRAPYSGRSSDIAEQGRGGAIKNCTATE